jgi:hypothetical protein
VIHATADCLTTPFIGLLSCLDSLCLGRFFCYDEGVRNRNSLYYGVFLSAVPLAIFVGTMMRS